MEFFLEGLGREQINFDDTQNCCNLALRKETWGNIKYKMYEKSFKKN
jgi:hypothetical protein